MLVKVYYKADDSNGDTHCTVIDSKHHYIDIKDSDIADNTTKSAVNYYDNNKQKTAKISSGQSLFLQRKKTCDVAADADCLQVTDRSELISNDGDAV